ncbi:uncharacterized protein LOC127007011 [Eriocheir sinensis]|uniref:uncharacterized protein LOC127007011 n=1 Tax=Eriocheir sinensis TaxID=95602 RepID=UPI0021C715AB|nr:uncharacterized protein LOC127007011 [Eriocheir sinensis]
MVLVGLFSSGRRKSPPASSSSSSLRLWTVASVLSTVVLLTAAEERSSRAERVARDSELEGLLDLEVCSAATRAPSKVRSDPNQIAGRIALLTKRCLEYLDEHKEEYTNHLLSMGWSKANAREPPKRSEDDEDASEVYDHETYLPVVPVGIPTQPDLNKELLKAYSLLQHYEVVLSHLALDQNEFSEKTEYRKYIQDITLEIENLLCRLLIDIMGQGLSPDFKTRNKLASEIYRREHNSGRRETRDFVFLRDTRAGLQYIHDTFSIFL